MSLCTISNYSHVVQGVCCDWLWWKQNTQMGTPVFSLCLMTYMVCCYVSTNHGIAGIMADSLKIQTSEDFTWVNCHFSLPSSFSLASSNIIFSWHSRWSLKDDRWFGQSPAEVLLKVPTFFQIVSTSPFQVGKLLAPSIWRDANRMYTASQHDLNVSIHLTILSMTLLSTHSHNHPEIMMEVVKELLSYLCLEPAWYRSGSWLGLGTDMEASDNGIVFFFIYLFF